jgi:hypothetical protein
VCRDLDDTGQPALVREIIAKRIIKAAKNGERDPVRLRKAGLAAERRQESSDAVLCAAAYAPCHDRPAAPSWWPT